MYEKTYYPEHGLQVEDAESAGDSRGAVNLARYWWAWTVLEANRKFVVGKDMYVIDVGCGCGYGTRILSERLTGDACGIDWDPNLTRHARENYAGDNVSYRRINLNIPWCIQFPKADLAVCFGVLDEVDDWEFALGEISQVLSKDGVLLLSHADRVNGDLEKIFDVVVSSEGDHQDGTTEHKIFKYMSDAKDTFPHLELDEKLIVCSGVKS
jgi:SAM-dependent methyltransferase